MIPNSTADGCGSGGGEIVLFGVRVVVGDLMRKCVSVNNLSEYERPHEDQVKGDGQARKTKKGRIDVLAVGAGYASADEVSPRCNNPGARERKRGVPWTKDEHKLFLLGLQKAGKGDWRGISKNFIKTRTPTQVASHAQKYFLRRTNLNRRRRSSLFDITTDSVAAMVEEQSPNQDKPATLAEMVSPAMEAPVIPPVVITMPLQKSFSSPTLEPVGSAKVALATIIRPISIVPAPSASDLPPFDLNLSLTSPTLQPASLKPATTGRSDLSEPSRRPLLAFRMMPLSFRDGDSSNSSIISVA